MTFAKEAWPFTAPFALAAAALGLAGRPAWALLVAALGLAVLLFFRDPGRVYGGSDEAVLAPADGRVTRVDEVEDPEVGAGRYHRVVTFLSLFDVHVQRYPVSGELVRSERRAGRKVAAFRADAGDLNERHLTVIRGAGGDLVAVRQIAGLLARRVVAYGRSGQGVRRGERLGIIKFGSRVDLLLPAASYRLEVRRGDRVKNGLTRMATRCGRG